jgi:hypothetical protein
VPGVTEPDAADAAGAAAGAVDTRADRIVEGVVAIALLAAFVFRQPLVVPAVALLLTLGAAFGPRADALHIAFATVATPRLRPAVETVPVQTIRAQDGVIAGMLWLASLAFVGLDALGWIATLLGAVVALVAATTGLHAGAVARERFHRHD